MLNRSLLAASAASLIMSTAAFADTGFSAGTDLNVRKGPGPGHPVVGVIPAGETVQINGCLSEANWCRVSYGTTDGWASSDYLTVTGTEAEGIVVLSQRPATVQVETITYDNSAADAAATTSVGVAGAAAGAAVAGPAGAVVGLILGAAAGDAAVEPTAEVVTYVEQNPVEPLLLDGEIVVGAGVPENVVLHPVPDSEFSYLYLNGQPVVISNADRRIVRIIR